VDLQHRLYNRLNAIIVRVVDENKINVVAVLSSWIVAVRNRVLTDGEGEQQQQQQQQKNGILMRSHLSTLTFFPALP